MKKVLVGLCLLSLSTAVFAATKTSGGQDQGFGNNGQNQGQGVDQGYGNGGQNQGNNDGSHGDHHRKPPAKKG